MSLTIDIAYALAAAALSPVWGYKLLTTGKWRTDWPARFGRQPAIEHRRRTLLLHAVSVGEVNAIRKLVEHLADATDWNIVIATTTDTGQKRARDLFAGQHTVVRYPLDFTFSVQRFLDAIQPDLVALVELELWPNFMKECRRRNIPVCVVNGRLSARSFKRYRWVRPLLKSTFGSLTAAAVQTSDYAQRFAALGTPEDRIAVLDTMKWDTAQLAIASEVPGRLGLAQAMGLDLDKPLIVAGSTGPGEEKLLIGTCPPEVQLLLVPRKPERFDEVAALVPGIVRRKQCPDGQRRTLNGQRFFLLDTMGELRKAYSLADVCLIGRSFLGLYGSDMIEPIALGKPTIIGTHHSDFADTMAAFVQGNGILVSDQPMELARRLLADRPTAAALAERGRQVILNRQGSTLQHANLLMKLMPAQTNTGDRR